MTSETLIITADICQSVTVLICLLAYIPQWITLIRNKSSKNISLQSWCLWVCSSLLGFFYANVQYMVYGTGFTLVTTTTANLIFIILTIGLIVHYRKLAARVQAVEEPLLVIGADSYEELNSVQADILYPDMRNSETSLIDDEIELAL